MGMAVYSSDSLAPRRGRSVPWWQRVLLPITFPVSLVVFALGAILPGLRARTFLKMSLVFLVVWYVLGQLTVWVDPDSGNAATDARMARFLEDGRLGRKEVFAPSRGCSGHKPGTAIIYGQLLDGGFPLGRLFVHGTSCSAELGEQLLTRSGFQTLAGGWRQLYVETMYDYLVRGRLGIGYVLLGVGLLVELVVVIPWLIVWGGIQLVQHLRWE